jgi:hypothetical protein
MSIIYGYLDTDKYSSIFDLIIDKNVEPDTNIDGTLCKAKWNSPTPQAIADVVYVEVDRATAMAYYKTPGNGWVPED